MIPGTKNQSLTTAVPVPIESNVMSTQPYCEMLTYKPLTNNPVKKNKI